jgi:hypothetical protein
MSTYIKMEIRRTVTMISENCMEEIPLKTVGK